MTNEELGRELWPGGCPARDLWFGASIPEPKRSGMVRLIEVGRELALWQAGAGPKPSGVIVCGPRQIRRAGVAP